MGEFCGVGEVWIFKSGFLCKNIAHLAVSPDVFAFSTVIGPVKCWRKPSELSVYQVVRELNGDSGQTRARYASYNHVHQSTTT